MSHNLIQRILLCLFFLALSVFAEEKATPAKEKNPWAIQLEGHSFFNTYQLEDELEMPEAFGNMDTTKQKFIMRLAVDDLT